MMESLASTGPRLFDRFLPSFRQDELRMMARMWGFRSQLSRDEYVQAILSSLNDPIKVTQAIEALEPYERMALAIVKRMGGEVEAGVLTVGLYASGISFPPRYRNVIGSEETFLIDSLIRRGLVLSTYINYPRYVSSSFGLNTLFSDDRLLAQVGKPQVVPLDLKPAGSPAHAIFRRPQKVMLEVLGILQALESLGGLGLTRNGAPRIADERKLKRILHWEDGPVRIDGILINDPMHAWISALFEAGLLLIQDDRLVLAEPFERFASRSYNHQVSLLLDGFMRTQGWSEFIEDSRKSYRGEFLPQARLALVMLLEALPQNERQFFLVKDMDKALFDRVGEHFSIGYHPTRPFSLSREPADIRRIETEWRAKIRLSWLQRERKWLEVALTSWLFLLGIIELGLDGDTIACIRLTDLGRQVLCQVSEPQPASDAREFSPAWVVQPNFDIIVYLDRSTPAQLAFLEKHAERIEAQQHTASYRLTRDSVYRGLENGTSLDELLKGLHAGSDTDLPQNVLVEIREWSALRERITAIRQASMLEFSDQLARQVAIDGGLQGRPLGDRFLLLCKPDAWQEQPQELLQSLEVDQVDYERPLPKCLAINEKGEIRQRVENLDLMLKAQISRWTEPQAEDTWRLTRDSVQKALKQGARIHELFSILEERLLHGIPRLLKVTIMAWAGEPTQVELADISVLRCRNPEVFEAITSSKILKPYLLGALGPNLLLVNPQQLDDLKEHLLWAGIEISKVLDL
jgi:hypothetical protein